MAADFEAARLGEFQSGSSDPRIAGGFYFGRKAGPVAAYSSIQFQLLSPCKRWPCGRVLGRRHSNFRHRTDLIKVLCASCTVDLIPSAIERIKSIQPELPLVVVSEFEPSGEEWIQFPHPTKPS